MYIAPLSYIAIFRLIHVCHAITWLLYELEFLGIDGFAVVLWFDFNGLFDVQEIVRASLIHFGLLIVGSAS